MAGNVNDRFKQVATTSMLSSSSIQQNLTTSGTSMNQAYLNALSDVESTADEVDRTSDSSDTGMSSAEKTQMWVGLGTAVLAAVPGIMQGIAALKGGGQGGSAAAGGGAGGGAAGGDPLQALEAATNACAANRTDGNLKTLASAITAATSKRNSIAEGIKKEEAKIDSFKNMLVDGKAHFDKCTTVLKTLNDAIKSNSNTITEKTKFIETNQAMIDNIEANKQANGEAIAENSASIKHGEQNVTVTKDNFDQATEGWTNAEKAEAREQLQQNEYISQYNEAQAKQSGLDGILSKAKETVGSKSSAVGNIKERISGLEAQKKANKKEDADNTQINADIKQAKSDLKTAEKELSDAKKAEEKARKDANDNKALQDKLAEKIKVGDMSLAEAKKAVEQAKIAKGNAEKEMNQACTDLQGYVDTDKILKDESNKNNEDLIAAQESGASLNQQLAIALADDDSIKAEWFDADKATGTINKNIETLENALGNENDVNSMRGQLKQYDMALEKAEAVRNSDAQAYDAISKENEIYQKAVGLNYQGDVDGITSIEKDGENFKITKNGVTTTVDAKGKPVSAGQAPETETVTKPDGYKGEIPEGAKEIKKDGDHFVITMSDESTKKVDADGNEIK